MEFALWKEKEETGNHWLKWGLEIFLLALVPVNLEHQGPTFYEVIDPSPPQDDFSMTVVRKLFHEPELFIKFLKQIYI